MLRAFLRGARERLDPETRALGRYRRSDGHVGKPVTQDEVAAAAGISRNWYQALETRHGLRVSMEILARLAHVLGLDEGERLKLFQLAVPELKSPAAATPSRDLLEAFGSLRRLGNTLWAATTPEAALVLVCEYVASRVNADFVSTTVREDDGQWGLLNGIGAPHTRKVVEEFLAFTSANVRQPYVDAVHWYPLHLSPGDVVERGDRVPRDPQLLVKLERIHEAIDCHDHEYLMAPVRSKHGYRANLTVLNERARGFSSVERAHLSGAAQLASYALSGL